LGDSGIVSSIGDSELLGEAAEHVHDAAIAVVGVHLHEGFVALDGDGDGVHDVPLVLEQRLGECGFGEGVVLASEVDQAGRLPELGAEAVGVVEEEFGELGTPGFASTTLALVAAAVWERSKVRPSALQTLDTEDALMPVSRAIWLREWPAAWRARIVVCWSLVSGAGTTLVTSSLSSIV
jgi:hypothetical protein